MKRIVIIAVVVLIAISAALLVRSHFTQSKVLGLWSASSGASVQFLSSGAITIHSPSVAAGGSPTAPPVISGDYKILDGSHLQITVSNYSPVIAEYSVSGDTLKMTTVADGPMTYTRAGH
jgi:hypothetical protein